jgi:protein-tyrosine-phosphatase
MVNEADLILTAESVHRSVIVQAEPLTFRRAFTVLEFGRLGRELPSLEDVTRESLKARVKEIAGRRGWVNAPEEGADEIVDPFGEGELAAQQTAAAVAEAIAEVSSALGLFPVRV